jgi:DNA-directed RNA polymerase specialized sigma24 family protein
MPPGDADSGCDASPRTFVTTHWSVVLTAGSAAPLEVDVALERLCRTYWWPLYAFVRRRGHDPHDAQDLTQEFFARLLAKDFLRSIDPAKGKFRSFLLAALEHFLANEWRRAHAQKRGGGLTLLSLDDEATEMRYQQVASAALPAVKFFEQQWAMTLLDQTISRLQGEFSKAGKDALFNELKFFLTGEKRVGVYAELAVKLQTSEPALKMSVTRMRQRYGELLRQEIANTVSCADEVEDELRALFSALS